MGSVGGVRITNSLQHQKDYYIESTTFRNGKYPTQEYVEVYKISRSCANYLSMLEKRKVGERNCKAIISFQVTQN